MEVLPNSMFSSCPASSPVVATLSPMRASNTPPPISVTLSTWPTMSRRMAGSVTAATGISTLCSTAMPVARAAAVSAGTRR
jgi:hypothetical protein